jgi:CDP-diacylglycerol--glycerol-3-phosphate 3-phosphatidyltransferase
LVVGKQPAGCAVAGHLCYANGMGSTIGRDIRTVPNIITLSRILLVLLGAVVYFNVSHGWGIVLSIAAGVTDYLDGYIARRTGQVTRLGEILDQFCDLCFESFLIVIATVQHFFPPVIICAYLLREFWVASVRRFMAAAHMNIPSSLAGKAKSNLIMWSFLPTFLSVGDLLPALEPYLAYSAYVIIGLGLLASYVSAWGYTRAFVTGYAQALDRID